MWTFNRFGVNLTIEEEKVEFPKGKENLKRYDVRSSGLYSAPALFESHTIPNSSSILVLLSNKPCNQDPETLSGTPVQRCITPTPIPS